MKSFVIDRFEGVYAICENEEKVAVSIPKYRLPLEARPGSKIFQDEEGMFHISKEIPEEKEKKLRGRTER
jgi:flagellar basal body rod protein FlgF